MTCASKDQYAQTIAFFDFDGTLTSGDTLMPFLKYVTGAHKYYTKLLAVSPVLMAYFTKMLRNDVAKQAVLKHFLAGHDICELYERGHQFSRQMIPAMLNSRGMKKLEWHRKQGHQCVLVSASLDIYLRDWSQSEGFSHLLCSRLEVNDQGIVTGKLKGDNCFGETKVTKIKQLLNGKSYDMTYAYGDTKGDLPMLKFVDKGVLMQGDSETIV